MSDDPALEVSGQDDGEVGSVEFGDVLTAPFGQAVIGLAMSVYGGLLASFVTVAVTSSAFVGVAGFVASLCFALKMCGPRRW